MFRLFLITTFLGWFMVSSSWAFVVIGNVYTTPKKQQDISSLRASLYETAAGTSSTTTATTVDPTSAIDAILGNLIDSPAILAVPIVTALGLATLIAWFIIAYAEPQVSEDD